jgi:transcription factor CON7
VTHPICSSTDKQQTEFKEIRREWKARKKEEETQRKAAEEQRQRNAGMMTGSSVGMPQAPLPQLPPQQGQQQGGDMNNSGPRLPPMEPQNARGTYY